MSRNRVLWAPWLVFGIAVALILAPAAQAQSGFKTLHRFNHHSVQGG
jgi:hypothetical protein